MKRQRSYQIESCRKRSRSSLDLFEEHHFDTACVSHPNIVKLILDQERGNRGLRKESRRIKYSNFSCQDSFDLNSVPGIDTSLKPVEVCAPTRNILLVTCLNGICAVYDKSSKRFKGVLNSNNSTPIISVYINRGNSSLLYITLGENTNRDLVETQSQKQLICVEVSIEDLENWNLENRRQLLKSENLQLRSSIEFDEINDILITYSDSQRTYKIWSLKDYSGLFAVKAENVEKVVCSPGKLLLLSAIKDATMVMKIVDVKAKKLLYNFKVRNLEEDKNYFVELFDNSLLLKQTGNEARIINLCRLTQQYSKALPSIPNPYITLFRNRCFLGYVGNQLQLLDKAGKHMLTYDGNYITRSNSEYKLLCTSKSEQVLMASCLIDQDEGQGVAINCVKTGDLLSQIRIEHGKICCIEYDEQSHQLFVANSDGKISIWTNAE